MSLHLTPTSAISPRAVLGTAVEEATTRSGQLVDETLSGSEAVATGYEVGALADLARATGVWSSGSSGSRGLPASTELALLNIARDSRVGAELAQAGDHVGAGQRFGSAFSALDALGADLDEGTLRLPPDMLVPVQPAMAAIRGALDDPDLAMRLLEQQLLPRISTPFTDAHLLPQPAPSGAAARAGAELVDATTNASGAEPFEQALANIDRFSRNVSHEAARGDFDELFVSHEVVDKIVAGLADPGKAGVLIVGEPGVGKTSNVRAAALRMVRERERQAQPGAVGALVPRSIVERDMLQIDLGKMLAGTRYRGDLEAKVVAVIEKGVQEGYIPFLDEAQDLVQAGSDGKGGGAGFGTLLKTVAGDKALKVAMTTTFAELQMLKKDGGAFLQRFQIVLLPPPTPQQAHKLLTSRVPGIERGTGIWVDPPGAASYAAAVAARGEELSPYGAMPRIGEGILSNAAQQAAHRRDRMIAEVSLTDHALATRMQRFVDLSNQHMGLIHEAQGAGVETPAGLAARARAKGLLPELEELGRSLGTHRPEVRMRADDIKRAVAQVIEAGSIGRRNLSPQQLNLAAVTLARDPKIRHAIDQFLRMNKIDKRQSEFQKQQVTLAVRSALGDPLFLRQLSTTAPEVRGVGELHAQLVRKEIVEFIKEEQAVVSGTSAI